MKNLILLSFVILILPVISFTQEITKYQISSAIDTDELTHPYLFFDKDGLKEIKNHISTDPESKKIMTRLQAEADMLMHMPASDYVPPRGKNTRAGWSEIDRENSYESKMIRYARHAQLLAFVHQITGEEAYAQKAFEFAEVVCIMPVWIMQAHEFSIIYSRVMPWNVADNQVNFNFDIRTSGLGEIIACVYDWTYNALEKWQRDKIRGALLEKVITPVRGDYEFHW